MRVKAIMDGYYGEMMRYAETAGRPASVFNLVPFVETDPKTGKTRNVTAEEQFSHEWMERVDGGPTPEKKKIMPLDVMPPPPPPSVPADVPKTPTNRTEPAPIPAQNAPTGDREVI